MSELLNSQRRVYEPPSVVQREAIIALLGDAASPSDTAPDGIDSDVNVKEHIRPVRW